MITDIEDILVVPTVRTRDEQVKWRRDTRRRTNIQVQHELENDFHLRNHSTLSEEEALQEAARCLKCADAPCQKGCPSSIDVKAFISCIQNRNYYGAAKVILTANPLGYSCGLLCMQSELCGGCCNLSDTRQGAINISGLQEFAMHRYHQMGLVPSIRTQPNNDTPIAIVGAGPSSLSCATYLARFGYGNVTILERRAYGGGIGASEIPQFRLPSSVVEFEMAQTRAIVKEVRYNQTDVLSDLQKLLQEYKAVFLGVGKGVAKHVAALDHPRVVDSKSFLNRVAMATKPATAAGSASPTPFYHMTGRVLVLGAGDVAMDCARTALRCGANRVTIALRRNTNDIRATEEEIELVRMERVDMIPYALPKHVTDTHIEFYKTELEGDGSTYTIDHDQTFLVQCDHIISAFGSVADPELTDLINETTGCIEIDEQTGATKVVGVFAGGDIVGSGTQVEASNDGKIAAYGIHRYLTSSSSSSSSSSAAAVPPPPPVSGQFMTAVDAVDLSIDVCGMKFMNPFGLASAPPATSGDMIARAFDMGWAFAVTKTFTGDVENIHNVTPRIMSSVQTPADRMHWKNGFMNIELISEKSSKYWCDAIRSLKAKYPQHRIIASIMSTFSSDGWQSLARQAVEAGADALELNTSCPHGMHEKGMGLALGVYPDKVAQVVRWVCEVTDAASCPVFVKLTPNITDITDIATAAKDAGAAGVVAINTVSGLVGFHANGEPMRRAVGAERLTTYGGLCGNNVRPIALRAVSAIARKFVDDPVPIMATGGIDSADTALQFMYAGASLVQVCSAVMNQDYTVINDYIAGLKMLLFMRGASSLASWDQQDPPPSQSAHHIRPAFGDIELERRQERHRVNMQTNAARQAMMDDDATPVAMVDVSHTHAPSVADLVGFGLSHVTTFNKLPAKKDQVVVAIDDDLCLRCGKCYLACTDNGYQALEFDPITHLPTVDEDKCTGCGLCESICPAINCITFKVRDGYKPPDRGGDH